MIDRKMDAMFPSRKPRPGAPVLATELLGRKGEFADVSVVLRRGEILGVTGLVGSGAKASPAPVRRRKTDGRPRRGRREDAARRLAAAAVASGVALVPEDRRANGVSLDLTVRENATLPSLKVFSRFGFLDRRKERRVVAEAIAKLDTLRPGSRRRSGRSAGETSRKSRWRNG